MMYLFTDPDVVRAVAHPRRSTHPRREIDETTRRALPASRPRLLPALLAKLSRLPTAGPTEARAA